MTAQRTLNITTNHNAERHYAECHYAECHYAECHYAECHYAECGGAIDESPQISFFALMKKV